MAPNDMMATPDTTPALDTSAASTPTPSPTPTPAPQPQQSQPQPQAPATAPASALPPSKNNQIHGVLGGVLMGALAGAAKKVGTGIKNTARNFAMNSPRGQELQKNALDRQAEQQRMQLAQKQEGRDETKSMDEHTEAMLRTNGMTLDNMHKVAENAHTEALYPLQEAGTKATLQKQLEEQNAADRDLMSTLEAAGVHIDTSHGPGHANLTQDHAQSIATGKQTGLSNGKTGDDAGFGFISNQELENTVLPADAKVATDWTLDSKTGTIKPTYSTLQAGQNTAMDVLIAHDAGMKKFNQLQGQYSQQLADKAKQAETTEHLAAANEAYAGVKEKESAAALNDAYVKQIGGSGGAGSTPTQAVSQAMSALPAQVQKDLQQYNPMIQGLLIRGAHGWIDPSTFPTRLTKGGIGITRASATAAMTEINPNYTDSLYNNIKKAQADYVTGKEGQSIRSFNQFLVHAQELKHVSDNFVRSNSPLLNEPLNAIRSKAMGDPGVPEMMTAVEAARQEWTTFINSGYSPDENMNKRADILMSDKSTPAQIMGVIGVMGNQAVGRLDQLNESYRTATGQDYPNLVTPSGSAASKELGVDTSKYQSGGSYAGGATPNAANIPPGARPITINGKLAGYTQDGVNMIPLQ